MCHRVFSAVCVLGCGVLVGAESDLEDGAAEDGQVFTTQEPRSSFGLLPYRPNYGLIRYADPVTDPYQNILQDEQFDELEIKFQISLKYILAENIFTNGLDLEFAYTTVSWWQAFNGDVSSPFRETNYEPELILNYRNPWTLGSLHIDRSYIALNHQSNGRGGNLSRSWNRLVAGALIEQGRLQWDIKTWWRIPEDGKNDAGDTQGDDNPNIERYMGYGELRMLLDLPREHKLDVMLRNNLRTDDNKGAIEIGWSFLVSERLRAYVQYFKGYGEGLIYYNQRTEHLGLGIKLSDW